MQYKDSLFSVILNLLKVKLGKELFDK
jgi:hypothetical protein